MNQRIKYEHIHDDENGRFFIVLEPFVVTLSNGEKYVVPAGMKTDLCSVPVFLWSFFQPYGSFLPASIVHDAMYIFDYRVDDLGLYKAQLFADREMLFLSKKYQPNRPVDNYLRFFAVRLFGWFLFRKLNNRKKFIKELNYDFIANTRFN